MYDFIRNMWVMKRVTAEKVQMYVPKYITQEECDAILATPQNGLNSPKAIEASSE